MKKHYFMLAILLCHFVIGKSQNIGINEDGSLPDNSSMLDVKSLNRGLLAPRVALTATNAAAPVTAPATSLLVYNTATAGTGNTAVVPGFYYWAGTEWVRISSAANIASSAWVLGGNAGIYPVNQYIGTSDGQVLNFRINNIPAGK